jgi:hypothetical protein
MRPKRGDQKENDTKMRGGKRKGSGAKPGCRKNPEDKARRFNTTMAPDLLEWLNVMRRDGHFKAAIIDRALRDYRGRLGEKNGK